MISMGVNKVISLQNLSTTAQHKLLQACLGESLSSEMKKVVKEVREYCLFLPGGKL